jgi:pimeloyl-ACP methyl ester carboxylesterase
MAQLFYREINETNRQDAIPMIILHGFLGSCDNWLTVSKQLATHYRIFLLDQRNHGRSEWASPHTYIAMAEDLKDFISSQNLTKPIIVGHSMGGKTALQFAATYPDLFEKMVVVDITPKMNIGNHQQILGGLNAINFQTLSSRAEADAILSEHEPDFGVRQFLLKNLYKNEQDSFAWRMNLKLLSEEYQNVLQAIYFKQAIHKPIHFIRGAKSDYVLDKEIAALQLLFPKMHLKTVANAGHWVQAEQPAAFIDALLSLLQ